MRRTNFKELLTRKDQRYKYVFQGELPDESCWKRDRPFDIELYLFNTVTKQGETICIKIDSVLEFPLVHQIQFVGYALSDDESFRVRVDGYLYYSGAFESVCYAYAVPPRMAVRLSPL